MTSMTASFSNGTSGLADKFKLQPNFRNTRRFIGVRIAYPETSARLNSRGAAESCAVLSARVSHKHTPHAVCDNLDSEIHLDYGKS